jgi:uncharacterized cupredoxin-like copper-binding protein
MRQVFASRLLSILLLTLPVTVSASSQDSMQPPMQDQTDSRFGHPGRTSEVTRTVQITIKNSRFLPGRVDVRTGEIVQFEIINRDTIAHEFVIGDVAKQVAHEKEMATMPSMPMSDAKGVTIAAGKTATVIRTFTHQGELQYACHLPGHYLNGMVGWLIVRD